MDLRRSVYRYRPQPNRDGEIIKLLLELAHGRPEQGFGKLFKRLRRLGHGWNHKRVYRVYCALKLNKRRKGKRRLPTRNPAPLQVSQTMNECWSADFMSDALWQGPRFRTFNVVDDFNREALTIVIDFNLPAARVVRELDQIAAVRGYPLKLRLDNGPEFIARFRRSRPRTTIASEARPETNRTSLPTMWGRSYSCDPTVLRS